MRKFFRTYFFNRMDTDHWGLVTRNSLGAVMPIYKGAQLFGGKTWSISLLRTDPPQRALEFFDNTEEVMENDPRD